MFWQSDRFSARDAYANRRGFYTASILVLFSLVCVTGWILPAQAAKDVPLPTPRPASHAATLSFAPSSSSVSLAAIAPANVPLPAHRPADRPADHSGGLTLPKARHAPAPGPTAPAERPVATAPEDDGARFVEGADETIHVYETASGSDFGGVVPVPVARPAVPASMLLQVTGVRVPARRPLPVAGTRLSEEDAALYREIFALQEKGKISQANERITALSDMRLMGHVLYQRFMHPTAYRTSYDELKDWLGFYADLPGASDIYDLALKRRPSGQSRPAKPAAVNGISGGLLGYFDEPVETYRSSRRRSSAKRREAAGKMRSISRLVARGYPTRALAALNERGTQSLLDTVEKDMLRGEIARSYLFYGKFDKAQDVAVAASDRSGPDAALAGWVAGLCKWINGDYAAAAPYFENVAKSRYASSWTISAGAYWAARSYTRIRQPQKVSHWLKHAAGHQRTFYGVIASRALGMRLDFSWDMPELKDKHLSEISRIPAGGRALALLDAGQPQLAEQELRRINPGNEALLREAMVSLAHEGGMPYLSMRLGSALENPHGGLYDVALYPEAPWQPKGGFKVDRALVQAFIRQESKFDPQAFNRSGASGLMQLMPDTASYLSGGRRFKGTAREALYDPVLNIDLGQRYLDRLLKNNTVDGNLFYLAAAYNAGPGNLSRWRRELANTSNDPLLFVETIPVAETRAFIERVMTNLWIYRLRYDQPTPSLTEVAEGRWPQYDHLDDPRLRFAQNRAW